jgi:hypothetical protein
MMPFAARSTCKLAPCLLSAALLFAAAGCAAAGIDAVFFAQTHVQKPDSPDFKLVGNRDALIKVHVTSPTGVGAPPVSALLSLHGAETNLALRGPATLPASIPIEPGVVRHRFDDSFTAMIPKEWIQHGLQVRVKAGEEEVAFKDLKVGAPTVVNMTMFDIHYFNYEDLDYPKGWESELEARWPVAKLKVQRIPRILFRELVIPPRPGGLPATRCSSPEEYLRKTGKPFDGEQMAAGGWKGALQAAGAQGRLSLFFVNICNVYAGGQAGGFGGVGKIGRVGVLHHELGHALGRPHLMNEKEYPYVDTMYGIVGRGTHVGPTWGFDPRIGLPGAAPGMPYFIPPVVQTNAAGGVPGEWKHDPMQGGMSDEDKGFLLRMFSDYSMHKMQEYLEGHVARWDDARHSYVTWDDEAGTYSQVLSDDGFPVERDVEVVSLIAGVSAVVPEANIAYPPIGPYTSGLVRLFDPTVSEDRAAAAKGFAPPDGCDVCLRVEQGGKVKTYMLPISWQPGDAGYRTRAINLPARDGKITRVELLLTPDADKNGLPADPKVLDSWK